MYCFKAFHIPKPGPRPRCQYPHRGQMPPQGQGFLSHPGEPSPKEEPSAAVSFITCDFIKFGFFI